MIRNRNKKKPPTVFRREERKPFTWMKSIFNPLFTVVHSFIFIDFNSILKKSHFQALQRNSSNFLQEMGEMEVQSVPQNSLFLHSLCLLRPTSFLSGSDFSLTHFTFAFWLDFWYCSPLTPLCSKLIPAQPHITTHYHGMQRRKGSWRKYFAIQAKSWNTIRPYNGERRAEYNATNRMNSITNSHETAWDSDSFTTQIHFPKLQRKQGREDFLASRGHDEGNCIRGKKTRFIYAS